MEEVKKRMEVIISSTIRGAIKEANSKGILREEIVTLIKENNLFLLIYFE